MEANTVPQDQASSTEPIVAPAAPTPPTDPETPTTSVIPPQKNTMKLVLIAGLVLIVLLAGLYLIIRPTTEPDPSVPSPLPSSATQTPTASPSGPEPTSTGSAESSVVLPIVTDVSLFDANGTLLPDSPKKDIIMLLPPGATFTTADSNLTKNVTLGSTVYQVTMAGRSTGLCPTPADDSGCTYTDQDSPNLQKLRVWKDNQGVFALNAISINVEEYFVDYFIVKKPNNAVFSAAEVATWEEIIATLGVVPSESAQ